MATSKTTPKTKAKVAKKPVAKVCEPTAAPLSTAAYLGYEVLFALPIVGWFICVAFAFLIKDRNLRSFARSKAILMVVFLALLCLFASCGALKNIVEALGLI